MDGKGRKGRGEERRERQKEKEDLLWVSLIKSQSRKRFSLINLFIRSYLAKAFIFCSSPGCAFTIAGAFSGIRIFQKALVSLQRVRLLISSASTSRDLCALLLYIYIFFSSIRKALLRFPSPRRPLVSFVFLFHFLHLLFLFIFVSICPMKRFAVHLYSLCTNRISIQCILLLGLLILVWHFKTDRADASWEFLRDFHDRLLCRLYGTYVLLLVVFYLT